MESTCSAQPVRVAILGSTGSIGRQTLDVIDHLNAASRSTSFVVTGLTAHRQLSLLFEQIRRYRPSAAVITDPIAWQAWRQNPSAPVEVMGGPDPASLVELATADWVDLVVVAVVGAVGLRPTLAALDAGKTVALANKETLVIGGHLVDAALRSRGEPPHRTAAQRGQSERTLDLDPYASPFAGPVGLAGYRLRPIDSEHSAIWQALGGCHGWDGRQAASQGGGCAIRRLILTASGGPFRSVPLSHFAELTPAEALQHPNWKMGARVTVDSATMMNKGFEVMEASWLFGVAPAAVEVVVHPQAALHSGVEMADGSLLAQMGPADMRLPIEYALCFPRRGTPLVTPLNLLELRHADFWPVDPIRYPALTLAREVARRGGSLPAVLNAADEEAVAAFLAGHLRFPEIVSLVEQVVAAHHWIQRPTLEEILEADRWAREEMRQRLAKSTKATGPGRSR